MWRRPSNVPISYQSLRARFRPRPRESQPQTKTAHGQTPKGSRDLHLRTKTLSFVLVSHVTTFSVILLPGAATTDGHQGQAGGQGPAHSLMGARCSCAQAVNMDARLRNAMHMAHGVGEEDPGGLLGAAAKIRHCARARARARAAHAHAVPVRARVWFVRENAQGGGPPIPDSNRGRCTGMTAPATDLLEITLVV